MQLYNTLTRRKDALVPRRAGAVGLYVCGPTVYDLCHVGHARVFVVFDVLVRYLRHRGLAVRYVRNITDIDDKIIRRAAQEGVDTATLTARYIAALHEDAAALGLLAPDAEPRASAHLPGIVRMVETLIARGYAYPADNGDVYYAVQRFASYGRLSQRDPSELRAGARVEVNEAKRDALDFALWKAAKPGEPAWPSPWGPGRPGWHIECSAMSTACLGAHFDIHGGGADLVFPHHENEIAQSEAATGEPFVDIWMHNGFVRVHEEKMSKSLGNFFTIRDVLARYPGEVLRYLLLSAHYRSPLDYDEDALRGAQGALTRLYLALDKAPAARGEVDGDYRAAFAAAMDDDLGTPAALAVLFDAARELNRTDDPARGAALAATLRALGGVLGLLGQAPHVFLRAGTAGQDGLDDARIETLVAARGEARRTRDFRRADALRDELAAAGVILEDGPQGTRWRRG
jgi:cysteinyl-tRNA synthetase